MDNKKIDELLYGPAWVDESGEPTLRGVCCRLLHYAPRRVTVEQLNRIWEHPELGRLKLRFEKNVEQPLAEAGLHRYWGDEWRRFALRGRDERNLAFEWESLAKVPSFALNCFGRAYHCLQEMVVAVREQQGITMHVLTRQVFDIATALVFARLHLEHAHIIGAWMVADYQKRHERDFRRWVAEGVANNLLQGSGTSDIADDDLRIIAERVVGGHCPNTAPSDVSGRLPILRDYYEQVLKPAAPSWLIDSFRDLRKRTERLDRDQFKECEAVKRWHRATKAGFSTYHGAIWSWLSWVTHGNAGPDVWEEISNSQKEIKGVLFDDVHYPALLYFSAVCFAVTEMCFRELFAMAENQGFYEAFVELCEFEPRTGEKRISP